jgi:hypothetical protein
MATVRTAEEQVADNNSRQLAAEIGTTLASKLKTSIAALDRVFPQMLAPAQLLDLSYSPELVVYVLGCDESELLILSENWFVTHYFALIQYCCRGSNCSNQVRKLKVLFVGPNLNPDFDNSHISFNHQQDHQSCGAEVQVDVHVFVRYFHDIPSDCIETLEKPDIVLMMNAGIWGYESWKCTLIELSRFTNTSSDEGTNNSYKRGNSDKRTVCLITSYTLPEAEEDYDCIQELFDGKSPQLTWLWECELNPMRSSVILKRSTNPVILGDNDSKNDDVCNNYRDNHFWSCFEFIRQ